MKKNLLLIAFVAITIAHGAHNVQQSTGLEFFNPTDTFSMSSQAGILTLTLDSNQEPKSAQWCDSKPLQLCTTNENDSKETIIKSCTQTRHRCVKGNPIAVITFYETALLILSKNPHTSQSGCPNPNYIECMQGRIAQDKNSRSQLSKANAREGDRRAGRSNFKRSYR